MNFRDACLEMFARHRVEAFGGAFHVPDMAQYASLFAWDSGYHALALRHLDLEAARTELATLYRANTASDGLLAHERPAPGAESRAQFVVELLGPIYRPDQRSWLIDPPVAAYAAAMIADPARAEDAQLLEAAAAHLRSSERLRTIDGLPVILHPLESGTDVSPAFDAVLDVSSNSALLKELHGFAHRLAEIEYSVTKAVETKHPFVVSDPTFCGWHLLALEEVAGAWARFGRADKAEATMQRALDLGAAMARLMWSGEQGLFVGFDHIGQRQLATPTMAGVVAAASQCMELGLGRRVVDLLRPGGSRFLGPAGLSFNPITGEAPNHGGMLWRGDVVSAATHYWAHKALLRHGETALAERVRSQLEALIAISGFREFYDAESGEGVGAGASGGFTWPALALDMSQSAR
jgi:hypothetical protein